MPVNPEPHGLATESQNLVSRLRNVSDRHEQAEAENVLLSPRVPVGLMRQAANEIEDLAAIAKRQQLERLLYDLAGGARTFFAREVGYEPREEVRIVEDQEGTAILVLDTGNLVVSIAVAAGPRV